MLWPKSLNKRIKTKVNLSGYTSFKIGGPAEYFFEPRNIKELQKVLILAKQAGKRVFIIGAGSNILVSQAGLDAVVIKLTGKDFSKSSCFNNCILAGSGIKLNALVSFAKKKNLSGLEDEAQRLGIR